MKLKVTQAAAAAGLGLALSASVPAQAGPEPTLLYQFAQSCLWAQQNGQKSDCETVGKDASGAYAYVIKKDINGDWQYLAIPTAKVSGIEVAALQAPDAPNYLAYAWEATALISQHRGVEAPRQDLSLSVNSAAGRSQHQLHIHIDCIRPDVRQALHAHAGEITTKWLSIADAKWPELATVFAGHHYQVRWVDGPSLQGVNLFKLVADRDADTAGTMALQTLVVVGGPARSHIPGFYVLTDKVHVNWGKTDPVADDPASGEELMGDHMKCPVLATPPQD